MPPRAQRTIKRFNRAFMDYLLALHSVATYYDVALSNSREKFGQHYLAMEISL